MTESNHLALYDSARAALAKAVRVDEVKDIRDKAVAIKHYARIAKDREMEANAYELRARAERRLGEMLEAGRADRASQGGDRRSRDSKNPLKPTLKEAGIDKNLAKRARTAAKRPEKIFEEDVRWHREQILNPPPEYSEIKEARKQRRVAESLAALARGEKREPDDLEIIERAKQREERRAKCLEEKREEEQRAEPVAEIILPKRGTQSTAPEIISPTFTAKGAVNQTRFAEAMRSVKQGLRLAYALSDPATFFKHARDMLDYLEREVVPVTAEASAHQRTTEPVH